jgi:predicted ester cyclase
MSLDANKAAARRLHEDVESAGRIDLLDDLVAPGFIDARHPERGAGPESVREHVLRLRATFPDLAVTVDDLIGEGDRVVTRVTSRGTHRGAFAGAEPSGRQVNWSGIVIRRFVDGRMVEQWSKHDLLALLQQIGASTADPRP